MDLGEVADELARRLVRLFLQDKSRGGRRPVFGDNALFQADPHWRDYVPFHEYFHGDDGAGLGASHQTGWTALVAELMIRPAQGVAATPSRPSLRHEATASGRVTTTLGRGSTVVARRVSPFSIFGLRAPRCHWHRRDGSPEAESFRVDEPDVAAAAGAAAEDQLGAAGGGGGPGVPEEPELGQVGPLDSKPSSRIALSSTSSEPT